MDNTTLSAPTWAHRVGRMADLTPKAAMGRLCTMPERERIGDRYTLEQTISAGGTATVYRACDRESGAQVALKLLHHLEDDTAERFRRESKLLAQLTHPGIVRYLAHGTAESGEQYLVTEWLDGVDLRKHLLENPKLTIEQCLALAHRVSGAVGFAHARGIVHRDLKPGNLFLPEGDVRRAMVLDFGIARSMQPTLLLTRTGETIGSPGYVAPEQARGSRDIDTRVDVFSLGCVFFECLAGVRPFTGENLVALLTQILFEEPPRLEMFRDDVPEGLNALLRRMLAKNAEERPKDGAAVAWEIAGLMGDSQSPNRKSSTSTEGE